MAMEEQQQQGDPFLFVLLGFDTLYSINLNHLHLLKKEEEEADLRIVFSHKTHKQVPGSGKPYPLGMGLFVHNSKLHFFGGENINDDTNDGFQNIEFEMGKHPRPLQSFDKSSLDFLERKNWDDWINKKVFSFTPILKSDEPNLVPITPLIPSPSSYKMRPIVFTISNKVYALSALPFYGTNKEKKEKKKDVVFEVLEPNVDGNLQWTKLANPPKYISMSSRIPISHCVIKNQLLLQTQVGDFIFDPITRKWFLIPYDHHDLILAYLEYKDQLLLCYGGGAGHLVAYDLNSFEAYKKGLYFSPSSNRIKAISEKTFSNGANVTNMGNTFNLAVGSVTNGSVVFAASLSIVDDDSICLVLSCFLKLFVCHFEFKNPPCELSLKASKMFYLPLVMTADPRTISSFVLKEDDGKSNQDSTTGSFLHREKAKPPFEEEKRGCPEKQSRFYYWKITKRRQRLLLKRREGVFKGLSFDSCYLILLLLS